MKERDVCDHEHDDEAPTLEVAATKSRYLWSTPARGEVTGPWPPGQDEIRFDVSGDTLADLRAAARKVLDELLADAGSDQIRVSLEIQPDEIQELGDVGPLRWQAEVTAVLAPTVWLRGD